MHMWCHQPVLHSWAAARAREPEADIEHSSSEAALTATRKPAQCLSTLLNLPCTLHLTQIEAGTATRIRHLLLRCLDRAAGRWQTRWLWCRLCALGLLWTALSWHHYLCQDIYHIRATTGTAPKFCSSPKRYKCHLLSSDFFFFFQNPRGTKVLLW